MLFEMKNLPPDGAFPIPDALPAPREEDGIWKEDRIWSHLLKCLHFALLRELEDRYVARFWSRFSLDRDGETLTGKALANALVTRQFLMSMDFLESVLAAVEPYLLEMGRDPLAFAEAMGEVMLHSFETPAMLMTTEVMRRGRSSCHGDPVLLILQVWTRAIGLLAPAMEIAILEGRSDGRKCYHIFILDPRWASGRSPGWDPLLFTCAYLDRLLSLAGRGAGIRAEVVASPMVPSEPQGDAQEGPAEDFRIDGTAYGRRVRFFAALAESGVAAPLTLVADRRVMVCDRDYRCPSRNRITLARGGIYGAPCTVLRIVPGQPEPGKNVNLELIERVGLAIQGAAGHRTEFRKRHREFMNGAPPVYAFTYDAPNEKIYLQGKTLISGLGAKILMRILWESIHSSKREFFNRELKNDPFIGVMRLRTNFEVRLSRVLERLKTHCPLICVQRKRSGAFLLESEIPLTLAIDERGAMQPEWRATHRPVSAPAPKVLQRDNSFGKSP